MKGNHGLIGVGRAWCYAIYTKRSCSNVNPMDSGPTVYMRWSVSPLRAPDNHLEPFVYCKPLLQPCCRKYLGSHSNLLTRRVLRQLTIALGRESFDTFTVGKASQKAERRSRSALLIFILWSVELFGTHTAPVCFSTGHQTSAHTHWSREPTSHHGQRKRGVASRVIPSLSHSLTSLFTTLCPPRTAPFPSPIPQQKEVYIEVRACSCCMCRLSTAELLGTGLLILRGASTCHERAG